MKPVRTATLGGMRCRVDEIYTYGEAWSPKMKDSQQPYFRFDDRLKGKVQLDTIIHEAMHLQNPRMREEGVLQRASELANLLWRLGYRRTG